MGGADGQQRKGLWAGLQKLGAWQHHPYFVGVDSRTFSQSHELDQEKPDIFFYFYVQLEFRTPLFCLKCKIKVPCIALKLMFFKVNKRKWNLRCPMKCMLLKFTGEAWAGETGCEVIGEDRGGGDTQNFPGRLSRLDYV